MNAGTRAIDWLYHEQLRVDDEWAERTPRGFRWWADKHAQSIEVIGQAKGPDGKIGYLLSVRTELLRCLELDDRSAAMIHGLLMPFASMSGPVYDSAEKVLSLASLVRTYRDISDWMNPLISVAAVLQIGEARILGTELASVLHAEEAISGPKGRGVRPVPDEMADVISSLIAPLGREASRWRAPEFQRVVDDFLQQPPALRATSGGAGFTVEFPFGERTSLCQVGANDAHPRYGNGLFLLQSFPSREPSDAAGVRLALSMNEEELSRRPLGYGFGSYAFRDGKLHFTAFLPNAMYRPGLLPNIYCSCAQRARALEQRLA